MKSPMALPAVMLLAGAAGVGYFADDLRFPQPQAATGACDIKGNVSLSGGERIYHVPGQKHYSETVVRPELGERWFCSEAEAISAGWRRSQS